MHRNVMGRKHTTYDELEHSVDQYQLKHINRSLFVTKENTVFIHVYSAQSRPNRGPGGK